MMMNQLDKYPNRKIFAVSISWNDGQMGYLNNISAWSNEDYSGHDTSRISIDYESYQEGMVEDNFRSVALELLSKYVADEKNKWYEYGECGSDEERQELMSEVENYLVKLKALDQKDYYKERVYRW